MSDAVRHRVAEQLEKLNEPGEELSVTHRRSTWLMHGDSPERLRIWETIIGAFLDDQKDVAHDGELIVVTAGPPGAGKSRAVDLYPEAEGCRRIDPDRIKELLITRAVADRTYEHLLQRDLADGRPIMPLELSGLVHEESVRLASEIKLRCLESRENVLIEGTLNWPGTINVYIKDMARHDYENLSIISLEVPIEVALERAADRWWLGRSDASNLLGGRFVPRAVIAASYTDDGRTLGSVNAQKMAREVQRAGFNVRLESLSGAGSATIERAGTHDALPNFDANRRGQDRVE